MGGYNTNQGWLNKVEKLNSNGEIMGKNIV